MPFKDTIDTPGHRRPRKNSFCHSHWKLPLQGDAFWFEKSRVHLPMNDDQNVSKSLHEAETRYLPLEKAILAMVQATQKFPYYFQAIQLLF